MGCDYFWKIFSWQSCLYISVGLILADYYSIFSGPQISLFPNAFESPSWTTALTVFWGFEIFATVLVTLAIACCASCGGGVCDTFAINFYVIVQFAMALLGFVGGIQLGPWYMPIVVPILRSIALSFVVCFFYKALNNGGIFSLGPGCNINENDDDTNERTHLIRRIQILRVLRRENGNTQYQNNLSS